MPQNTPGRPNENQDQEETERLAGAPIPEAGTEDEEERNRELGSRQEPDGDEDSDE